MAGAMGNEAGAGGSGAGSGGAAGGAASSPGSTATMPGPAPAAAKPKTEPAKPWLWHVVLLDDQEHTYQYVVRLAQEVFGHNEDQAWVIARTVDTEKRAILMTTHRELAELKREQVLAFGRDPLMTASKGPMGVVLEPAPQ
jgi:ATP-dependent Clp protease adaptor protein ClpS